MAESIAGLFSLVDLELFVRAAETGSLSRAARELALRPATASASLKRLERRLASRLMVRSTRSLRLTPAGEALLVQARQALALLRDAHAALAQRRGDLRGRLRVSAPSDCGRQLLRPWLDEFLAAHPALELELSLSDRMTDFYREPVDLALRYGVPEDSALIVRPLLTGRRVAVAAPEYLARHGEPAAPEQLAGHDALGWMIARGGDSRLHDHWEFSRGRERRRVAVRVRRASDDGAVVRDWAVAGLGIAYKSSLDVEADLRAGRLRRLLPEWEGEPAPLNAVLAFREYQPPAVRALLEFLLERAAARAAR